MSDLDIATLYMPTSEELDAASVREVRSAMATRIKDVAGDVAAGPNTPFGDLFLTPAAVGVAITREAWRRFFSDMDLGNVAAGTVYNCAFVTDYLDQLGLYDGVDRKAHALARLTFADSVSRSLDRSTMFSAAGVILRPRLPLDGPLEILAPGTAAPGSGNYAWLIPIDSSTWVVDILLEGDVTEDDVPAAGLSMELDRTVDGLESATVLPGFVGGAPPVRIEDLAERARFNTHSSSPNTRAGVISGINRLLPDIQTIGCVVSGDFEMGRDVANPGGISGGHMDILVRGDFLSDDVVSQRFNLIEVDGSGLFFAELDLPEVPVEIVSVEYAGNALPGVVITSASAAPETHPGLSAAYGNKERLFLEVPRATLAVIGEIPVLIDEEAETPVEYAYLTVRYRFDPLQRMVTEIFGGDNAPVGISTYVRYFNPIAVNTLNVIYNRRAGQSLNLAAARAEILEKINRHTHHSPAGAADVVDSMAYAGAHSVEGFELDALVRYSCANKVYTGGDDPPEVEDESSYDAFHADTVTITHPSPGSFLNPDFTHSTPAAQNGVVGPRSATWLLKDTALIFTENRTLG